MEICSQNNSLKINNNGRFNKRHFNYDLWIIFPDNDFTLCGLFNNLFYKKNTTMTIFELAIEAYGNSITFACLSGIIFAYLRKVVS